MHHARPAAVVQLGHERVGKEASWLRKVLQHRSTCWLPRSPAGCAARAGPAAAAQLEPWRVGSVTQLNPDEDMPLVGIVRPGNALLSVEAGMFRAPAAPHRPQASDFLLVRCVGCGCARLHLAVMQGLRWVVHTSAPRHTAAVMASRCAADMLPNKSIPGCKAPLPCPLDPLSICNLVKRPFSCCLALGRCSLWLSFHP